MKRLSLILLAALLALQPLGAQSSQFKLGQWTEIYSSILNTLSSTYVDSLPVDRMMHAGVAAMLEELDPYTVYVPEEENEDFEMQISRSYGGIGAIIKKRKGGNVIINEPYRNSPAHKAGLCCGDEIIEVDGVSLWDLDAAASTALMKGAPGSKTVFLVKRGRSGRTQKVTLTRERIHLPDIQYAGMLDDSTGYVLQGSFTDGVARDLARQISALRRQGMKRLFLDLRGNGGGLMSEAVNIVGLFVPKGSLVVTARGKNPDDVLEYRTENAPVEPDLPVFVLIDSGSASASEIVAGALQDMDRACILGHRSFGKGLVQRVFPLAYAGQLKVTIAKYYTPSGRCVQAIDYAHRNEDGSVGHIPDSLTREFRTAGGRIVRDGGGITPDRVLPERSYSRTLVSLVMNGIIDDFAIRYYLDHPELTSVEGFRLGDEGYEEFIRFAAGQTFDYRSAARAQWDKLKESLAEEGLSEALSAQLDALEKALSPEKEEVLRQKKDEIIPFIEEEIVVRYAFQEAGVKHRLQYDTQLKSALAAK